MLLICNHNFHSRVLRLTLNPGQKGTKKLVSKYGDKLICVRYRYDEKTSKRYKTVELIEEEVDWKPGKKPDSPLGETVYVKVEWSETDISWQVKRAGGVRNKKRKVWELERKKAIALKLEKRIVGVKGIQQ